MSKEQRTIIGNCGNKFYPKEVEIKGEKLKVLNFSVCSNNVWYNVSVWQSAKPKMKEYTGKKIDFITKYLKKGSYVCVPGMYSVNKRQDGSDEHRIAANDVFLQLAPKREPKAEDGPTFNTPPSNTSQSLTPPMPSGGKANKPAKDTQTTMAPPAPNVVQDEDDDLPPF